MATSYRPASPVQRIAEKLVADVHTNLIDVPIWYVFREKAQKSKGKEVWGTARKVTGLNAYLTAAAANPGASDEVDYDEFFVIEIAEDIWAGLKAAEREALIDHELTHCVVDYDEEGDKVSLSVRPHDLEEFRSVVERRGFWRHDVETFVLTAHEAAERLKQIKA